MAYSDDLLEQANHLATLEAIGKPKQASLRRAVSAAYYALFHLITSSGAAACAPATPSGLRALVKRAFDHGKMKDVCKRVQSGNRLGDAVMALLVPEHGFSSALRNVSRTFVLLQEARHRADYDLTTSVSRADVRLLLSQTHDAILAWRGIANTDEASVFLTAMLYERLGR